MLPLILLAAAGLYLLLSTSSSLWDRDEPRFARAAVEMMESGNYLYPTFDGKLRADKPILIYWAMQPGLRLLGQTELAVRLPSIVGLLTAGAFTYLIGVRLYGPSSRAGLWATVMLLTTSISIVIGNLSTADGLLLGLIVVASWAIIEMTFVGVRWWHVVVLALALAGAQLTKGPVGLAVPMLTLAGMAWFGRRAGRAEVFAPSGLGGARVVGQADPAASHASVPAPVAELTPGLHPNPLPRGEGGRGKGGFVSGRVWLWTALAALLGTMIFLAWAIPADRATDGAYSRLALGKHVVGRAIRPMEGHGGSGWKYLALLPMYVPVVIGGVFPWSMMVTGTMVAAWKGRVFEPRVRAVILGWAVPTFLLMSLVATKLPHYVLPIWPALALAMGGMLEAWRTGRISDTDRWHLRRGWWVSIVAGLVGATGLIALGIWMWNWMPSLRGPAMLVAGSLLATVLLSARYQARLRMHEAAVVSAVGMSLLVTLAALTVLPAIEDGKPAPHIASAVRAAVPGDPVRPHDDPRPGSRPVTGVVGTFIFNEPSLRFYLDAGPIVEPGPDTAVLQWITEPSATTADPAGRVLITTRDGLRRLETLASERDVALRVAEIAAYKGLNFAKGIPLEVVAVRQMTHPSGMAD